MRKLEGLWQITQHWDGQKNPYFFNAMFHYNGTRADGSMYGTISINVPGKGPFYGTYISLGNTSYLSMAIADFSKASSDPENTSVSTYVGNIAGLAMGGEVTGAQLGGKGTAGVWSARLIPDIEVEEKPFHVAGTN